MLRKLLIRIFVALAISFGLLITLVFYQFRDRNEGYSVDVNIDGKEDRPLKIGVSKLSITPEGFDTWNDVNHDARYKEGDGDTYNDLNKNGKFDPVWLAGFHQSRPANGVHDSLWARSMVIDDGKTRMALCAIDAIGLGNDEIIAARKRIKKDLRLDYVIIASTHVHSAPDLMGMWGPAFYKRGVDPEYMEYIIRQISRSIETAARSTHPARLRFAQDLTGAQSLVGDSRAPKVFDPGIRVMQAVDAQTGQTIGTLLNWANHPETLWSDNVKITSDFPHYYRQYIEKGIVADNKVVKQGLGGVAIYFNGAVGGLMTTRPPDSIAHPLTNKILTGATFEKADAQGMSLALLTLNALEGDRVTGVDNAALSIRAKNIELKMDNKLFHLAGVLGILKRSFVRWQYLRSEVSAWSLGPALFMHIPGELYPEILNGKVEAPIGQDYEIAPVEVPALRSVSNYPFQFMVGLSNDEIGYIIPKSQWDTESPFAYGREKAPYGEINSLGPETAPTVHREMLNLLRSFRYEEKPPIK